MQSKYMQEAIREAEFAAKAGEVPVGAVVVKDGKIIASAHNMCETDGNALLHAEIVAMTKAMEVCGDARLEECDLYVTLEPCIMCCGAISHARIRRLYFGAYDSLAGGVVSAMHCFNPPSPLRNIEYYCGIMEEECSELISAFFKNLRNNITSD